MHSHRSHIGLLHAGSVVLARRAGALILVNITLHSSKSLETRTRVVERMVFAYPIVTWRGTVVPCDVTPINIYLACLPLVALTTRAFVVVDLKGTFRYTHI